MLHHLSYHITILLISLLYAIFYLFALCLCGEFTRVTFLKYSDRLYEHQWYSLPVLLQKNLLIMMMNMNSPSIYTGYGIVNLSLESFTKVKWLHYTISNSNDKLFFQRLWTRRLPIIWPWNLWLLTLKLYNAENDLIFSWTACIGVVTICFKFKLPILYKIYSRF